MDKAILKATHYGTVTIGDKELACAVLEDGTRILTQGAVFKAFGRPRKGKSLVDPRNENMPSFVDARNLKSFADKVFSSRTIFEVYYIGKTGRMLTGYRAEILPLICEVYLLARDADVLSEKQRTVAMASDILMRSLAKVGIVALIDEATGYQYDRDRDALNKLLKFYVAEELMPWQRKFPQVYYDELCRLNGWPKEYALKRPGVVGTWTNTLIYEQLPDGVLDELKRKTPKSAKGHRKNKYFQWLTDDIGHPDLQNQMTQALTLFHLSHNMEHVWQQFEALMLKKQGYTQLKLPYEFDDKGYTIAPIEENTLSDFNKNLKKALEYKEATQG